MDDERQNLPSASSWGRYQLCAGSFQLEQEARRLGQEAHVGSEAAESGERKHQWLSGESIELDEAELTTVEFLKERADGEIQRLFPHEEPMILVEQRLWFPLEGPHEASGRFDRIAYTAERALIQDYKTGHSGPAAAQENAQLEVLAVLAALHLPSLTEIFVQIISGRFGISERRFDLRELAEAYERMVATLESINAPDPSFRPSVEACRYCGASNICQALKDKVLPMAKLDSSRLPDGERAAKLLDEVELLSNHLEEIKMYYLGRCLQDSTYQIPGYALVPGPFRRQVLDWPAARGKLEQFINKKELDDLANYSLPQIEKLLGKALKLKAKETKAKLAEILGESLLVKEGALVLKRSGLTLPDTASADFN